MIGFKNGTFQNKALFTLHVVSTSNKRYIFCLYHYIFTWLKPCKQIELKKRFLIKIILVSFQQDYEYIYILIAKF